MKTALVLCAVVSLAGCVTVPPGTPVYVAPAYYGPYYYPPVYYGPVFYGGCCYYRGGHHGRR
jgi:hypothetical protein